MVVRCTRFVILNASSALVLSISGRDQRSGLLRPQPRTIPRAMQITRRWIKNFSELSRPLSRLTGDVEWQWGIAELSFELIHQKATEAVDMFGLDSRTTTPESQCGTVEPEYGSKAKVSTERQVSLMTMSRRRLMVRKLRSCL